MKFVEDGFGVERKPVMYNDFVLIGPKADPPESRAEGYRRGAEGGAGQGFALHLARRQIRHAFG